MKSIKKSRHCFKIGDLSSLFHVGADSIRYYEKVGLLHPVRDEENNYRLYTIDDVRSMNTIRELLDLGFSTEEILAFEKDRRLEHVLSMLGQESGIIDRQIQALTIRKQSIAARIRSIRESQTMNADGKVHEITLPARQCMRITDQYMPDEMVNYQLAKFTADMPGKTSTIGACDCYTLDLDREPNPNGEYRSKSAFFYSPYLRYPCNFTLPEGRWCSITFRGPYRQMRKCLTLLLDYMKENGLQREGDVLEFCHIDRFETADTDEYVTELQAKVRG